MVDQFCHLTVLGREGYLEVISFQCDRFIIPVCCQRTVGGLNLSGDLSRGEYPLLGMATSCPFGISGASCLVNARRVRKYSLPSAGNAFKGNSILAELSGVITGKSISPPCTAFPSHSTAQRRVYPSKPMKSCRLLTFILFGVKATGSK